MVYEGSGRYKSQSLIFSAFQRNPSPKIDAGFLFRSDPVYFHGFYPENSPHPLYIPRVTLAVCKVRHCLSCKCLFRNREYFYHYLNPHPPHDCIPTFWLEIMKLFILWSFPPFFFGFVSHFSSFLYLLFNRVNERKWKPFYPQLWKQKTAWKSVFVLSTSMVGILKHS